MMKSSIDKSGGYYRINRDLCAMYHLIGREAMVFNSLLYLCARGPYTGSASDIADFSFCGTYKTALRMLLSLERKGLIQIERQGDTIRQIVLCDRQNVQADGQNVPISKEKRTKKENIIKEKNNNVVSSFAREEKKTAAPNFDLINRLFFMDTLIPADKPAIPANTGYYKIIVLEYGYMNPKRFVDEFYHYWDGQGWPERGNKLSLMRSWMDIFVKRQPKQKPNLSETERLVMRTFLDNIEQRLIVRLFNVVTGFEVYEKKIVFVVKNENLQDFANWLDSLPLAKIFAAYNRIVTVQPNECLITQKSNKSNL